MPGTVGRLHVKAAVRATVVVADVLFQDALGMPLSQYDDVVEAVPANGADDPFAIGVRFRGARGCGEEPRSQPADTTSEVGAIDGVPVMDQKPRRELGIGDGLDHALGGPGAAWMLGDAQMDDSTAASKPKA
jgi:hypothetical protein